MARGRSSVERGSDTHTPHPFLSFFLSSLFNFLEGLKPTHTPVRSPGTTAPLAESLPSRRSLQVTPPLPCAPGAGFPHPTAPTSWCPPQLCPTLLWVPTMSQCPTEVPRTGGGDLATCHPPSFHLSVSQVLAVPTGEYATRRVQGPRATAVGGEQGATAGRGELRRGSWSGAS